MRKSALLIFLFAVALSADDTVYKTNCAPCHGADGKGKTPVGKSLHVKDLSADDVQAKSDAVMRTIIIDGKGKMPGYKGKLSDEDITALVTFIRSLAPPK